MPMKREKIYKFDDFQRNTGLYSRNSSLVKSIKTEKRCGLSISKTQIKLTLFLILLVLQIVFGGGNLFANNPDKLKKTGFHSTQTTNRHLTFKTDSTKSYSFNERNKKRGLKPYIAPTLLISARPSTSQPIQKRIFKIGCKAILLILAVPTITCVTLLLLPFTR